MKRSSWIVSGGILAGLVLFGLGYVAGDYASFGRQYEILQRSYFGDQRAEFLLIKENLEEREMGPQAREYLKDRLYVLAAGLPPEYLRPDYRNFDFGPVDRTLLRGLRATARSDVEGKSYELAKARHNPGPAKYRGQVESNGTVETDARKSGARGSP
jgi:hypothetical protein